MTIRFLAILAIAAVSSQAKAQMSTFRLSNGVSVTLNTIEQANDVAMETMYDVGFMQEPEGMVQASHLLEHLVFHSPCEGFADREAMSFLNRVGSANAETLPAFTHYDYVVPKELFEDVAKIEADRMRNFSFSQDVLEREAKRCYQETDFVEANPQAGMLKHAFMACSHAWRFQSSRALVRSGMETFDPEKLRSFHSQYYNPSHLTIAITGSISEKNARQLLEEHIGSIAATEAPQPGIEWSEIPNRQTIRWDSKVRGICVAWQPPSIQSERTALSIMGLLAMQQLANDPGLKSKCDHVSCSNNTWSIGDVPLFAYATVRDEMDVDEIERLLAARFTELLRDSCAEAALQIVPFATQGKRGMTWAQIQQTAPQLMNQGRSEEAAIQLCLMQDALNRVLHSRLFGSEWANGNDAFPSLDAKQLSKLIDRVVTTDSQRVVHILPLSAYSRLDANGRGALTQVGTSGGLFVGVVNVQAELVVEPGFDNTQVVSADRLPDSKTTRMIDKAGKQATVTEATVTLENGVPLLSFQLKSTEPIAIQKLTGRVVNDNGKPISGAHIGAAVGRENAGSSVLPNDTVTDEDGHFQLDVPIQESMSNNLQFAAIVTKDGYAGIDTENINSAINFNEIDFGTIKLSKGHSLPVQVVDSNGKPVAGATIEPGNAYSLRRQAVRADANGRATLNNLPSGVIRASASHGGQSISTKLVVSEDESENTETTLKLAAAPLPTAGGEPRSATLQVGAIAPDWDLKGWSDGQERKIADYRGKVLVLDFWGVWCGPCVRAIPSMQALAEKYEPKDVVFLGIHTPDGEFDQIRKLKKLHGWTAPSGIDRGTSNADGTTSSAYGIRGYPSLLIIDRQGKIAFNSGIEPKDRDAFMEEMGELARANGIAWPPNEKAPQSEQEESMSKLMQAMFSREIDRVLE